MSWVLTVLLLALEDESNKPSLSLTCMVSLCSSAERVSSECVEKKEVVSNLQMIHASWFSYWLVVHES